MVLPSLLVISSREGGLLDLPLRACIRTCFPFKYQPSKGVRSFRLRPSSEAVLRARAPRAKKAPHSLAPPFLRPRVVRAQEINRPPSSFHPSLLVILPLQVCGGWKGWARRWRHSGKQCLVAVTESVRRHCAVSAQFHRSMRPMSRRPTARQTPRIMSPPTLPALRQRHPPLTPIPAPPLSSPLAQRTDYRARAVQPASAPST